MVKEDVRQLLIERIFELKMMKEKTGITDSRSYTRAIEWLDSLIKINERFLNRLG